MNFFTLFFFLSHLERTPKREKKTLQGHLPSHRVEEVPLRPGFLHRIADAHPELSMEQVLRLTQLALGRDDEDGESDGGGERNGVGNGSEEEEEDESEEEEEPPSDEDDEGAGGEEGRAAARARRAELRREARQEARREARRDDGGGRGAATPGPITRTTTTTTSSPTGPTATMELELDPSRLPRGFPFASVAELETFFSDVERAGPRNLPAEARELMERWFPDLATFLETHAGGGEGGEDEEASAAGGEAAEEEEVERS